MTKYPRIIEHLFFMGQLLNEIRYIAWKQSLSQYPILKDPIFIIGCPRSGTSIFAKYFGSHPLLANWSEAGKVWDPDHYYDSEAEHCWEGDKVRPEDAQRINLKFEWYRRVKKRERFVNKHPRNSVRIKYIRRIFPDAYFIHIVRDGRAVVGSIIDKIAKDPMRQKYPFGNFCKPPNWRKFVRSDLYEQTAWQWREIVQYILNCKTEMGDRCLTIKYEEMCASPHEVFRQAYEFAHLPMATETLSNIPGTLKSMNYKHKTKFTESHLTEVNRVQHDLLGYFEYCI